MKKLTCHGLAGEIWNGFAVFVDLRGDCTIFFFYYQVFLFGGTGPFLGREDHFGGFGRKKS